MLETVKIQRTLRIRELTEIEVEEIAAGYDSSGLGGAIVVGAGIGAMSGALVGPGGGGSGAIVGGLLGGMAHSGNGV